MGIDAVIVIISAVIGSLNPSAIGILILLVSVVLGGRESMKRLLVLGGVYIVTIFLIYLVMGVVLVYFFSEIARFFAVSLALIVGVLVIVVGLFEVKDYYWYGKGFSFRVPPHFAEKIHKYAKNLTIPGAIFLAAFISSVTLPYIGAPYLAVITMLSLNLDSRAIVLLMLYNFIFILPLLAVLLLVVTGTDVLHIKKWKHYNKEYMRFVTGCLLIGVGWLLLLIANGKLNVG